MLRFHFQGFPIISMHFLSFLCIRSHFAKLLLISMDSLSFLWISSHLYLCPYAFRSFPHQLINYVIPAGSPERKWNRILFQLIIRSRLSCTPGVNGISIPFTFFNFNSSEVLFQHFGRCKSKYKKTWAVIPTRSARTSSSLPCGGARLRIHWFWLTWFWFILTHIW